MAMPGNAANAANDDPRYPIGKFRPPLSISREDCRQAVFALGDLPEQLRNAVRRLSEEQMNTPYREGGWTVRQVVHHVADSHMTAFHRLRRTLTEENPLLPGYDEKAFALLPDVVAPAEWSLEIIEAVHGRWVLLLQSLDDAQWKRTFRHAERGPSTVEAVTLLYAWHSRHHVAHIMGLRRRQGW
jgi:uncharacterized damage-inducible protein DinB